MALLGVGNCMGLENCGCHDAEKRISDGKRLRSFFPNSCTVVQGLKVVLEKKNIGSSIMAGRE